MKRAHGIRKCTGISMSESICRSEAAYNLGFKISQLTNSFAYKKKDGTLKRAKGTLKVERHSEAKRIHNHKVLAYLDINKNGWRSSDLKI